MIRARILMIKAESSIGAFFLEGLRKRGHAVSFARDGVEGLRVFESNRPDVVLADVQIGESKGLEVLRQIRRIAPETKIILMTEDGTEGKAIEGLRGGTVSYLKKPVTLWELCEVIEKLVGIRHSEIDNRSVLEESKRIVMDNQIDKIWGVVNQLLICAENVCGKGELHELGLGLYEIIINAIEHGSLEITFEEKCEAIGKDAYEDLLRKRLSNPIYSERRVTIEYRMIPGELHYVIKDEGKGFNWRSLPCSDPVKNLLNPCGRGIFLARVYLDRVEFNEKGNEVHLVKYGNVDGGNHGSTAKHREQSN